jgi:tripartite-type tricarboxylate transporter receptor subunit TctC
MNPLRRRGTKAPLSPVIATAAAICMVALGASPAWSQVESFPSKPVRLVVGYVPGGSTDAMGRQVAQALSQYWRQPVVVENRPGAGANIGADHVAKAAPDGYTLLMWHDGLAANASLYKRLPYDPVKDLIPVSTIGRVSIVMGVATNTLTTSVKDVSDMAKAKPGHYAYASCGPGTPHHIAGEMFKYLTGTDLVHTAYKGCGPALMDVMGGHVPVFFQTLSNVVEQIKTGKVRVLAVADPERLPDYPNIPTMVEAGVPDFVMSPWYGIFAPGGTPNELVEKIAADIAKVVASPELQASLRKAYYQPMTMPPDQFRKLVRDDIVRLGKVIRSANMTAE